MYLTLKLFHVLFVVLFLGNITTGLFWHAIAAHTRDPSVLAHTVDGIIRSDRWFTMPGVIGILVTGVWAAQNAGMSLFGTGWIAWSLILFGISGILFGVRVAPLQKQMRDMARAGADSGDFDFGQYRRLAVSWEIWGAAALLTPFAALALMVLKPNL